MQATSPKLPNVKHIIAIASGKGGVGKSTTSSNIALALKSLGLKVGLLDADLYGPSQAVLLGANSKPESVDGKYLKPVISHGVQSMSIAYLLNDDDNPVIWRGPMVTNTLQQLIYGTQWQDLDCLIIDLPPGTGDIQITLAQKIPLSGAVIVTTPQDLSMIDASKALQMFNKVNVPIFGIIENMSVHTCTNCGHQDDLFGSGAGAKMAENYQTKLLGKLPLTKTIREYADQGKPIVIAEPENPISLQYIEIAKQLKSSLGNETKPQHKFPKIVVEHT